MSNTNIDWFVEWPNEALKEVAVRFLQNVDLGGSDRVEMMADMFVMIHDTTHQASKRLRETLKRYNYVTPSSYLDLVRGYNALLDSKRSELYEQRDKLKNGMSKLEETKLSVDRMTQDLKVKEEALRVKAAEVDSAMQIIQHQETVAQEQQAVLATEKTKLKGRSKQLKPLHKKHKQIWTRPCPRSTRLCRPSTHCEKTKFKK